jgi:hypothetical protein
MDLKSRFDELFVEESFSKSRSYIETGIWEGLDKTRLNRWISQFETHENKILCSFILESITYRTDSQLKGMLYHALEKTIPQALREKNYDFSSSHLVEILRDYKKKAKHKPISIVPVIRTIDPPTKSGPLVARLLKRHTRVNDQFLKWPWEVDNLENTVVIFIDDFVGTGNQFIEFFKSRVKFDESNAYIYVPLAAHVDGIKRISDELPQVLIRPVETISDENNFFNSIALRYNLSVAQIDELHDIYSKFLKFSGLHKLRKSMHYGFNRFSLCYCFQHAVPNASLPLIWGHSPRFSPLLER